MNERILGCPDCGLIQSTAPLRHRMVVECARCEGQLAQVHKEPVMPVLAWALTALLLCIPALFYPIFIVSAAGMIRQSRVDDAVGVLYHEDYTPLGLIVAAFTTLIPLFWLGGLATVLTCLAWDRRPSWIGKLFRLVMDMDLWAMPEVFLLGGFVAYTRLGAVATVTIGAGGWAYIALALAIVMVRAHLDRHHLWREIKPDPDHLPAEGAILCSHCFFVLPPSAEGGDCPRCGGKVILRKPGSLSRTAALVIAAYLLYIPANFLPVLGVTRLGREQTSTIVGGALELIHADMWPLALIVFLASIAVPVLKLFGLSWCLIATRERSEAKIVTRTKLYRLIDVIGRWSNIDVFMVALLATLVRFGNLASIVPEPGAVAFASVVLLTMLASRAFDPRLMWDVIQPEKTSE